MDWGMENNYYRLFENFVMDLGEIADEDDPIIQKVLFEICELLRVAEVRIKVYDSEREEQKQEYELVTLYQKAPADPTEIVRVREIIGDGKVVWYEAAAFSGETAWTTWMREKIEHVMKTLYAFHGRMLTMRLTEQLLYYDKQLEIPNIKYFFRNLKRDISLDEIKDYAFCYFNLRRFSAINDQIGRDLGDLVMKRFLSRFTAVLDGKECLCRIGGDNFILTFRKEKVELMKELLQNVNIVFDDYSNSEILIGTSAGFYVIEEGEQSLMPETILDRAGIAANFAKSDPSSSMVFYDKTMMENQIVVQRVEEQFPKALMEEEFQVYYQPKFSLEGEFHLVGAEALCRWKHDGKIIPPDQFIPVLEKSMNISRLDFYMLDHVCRDLRRWLDEGKQPVKVSVNLSRRHSTEVNLAQNILRIIDKYQVPHELLEIELTETSSDVDFNDLRKIVKGLQDAGVMTSVDDFGVGYSSLNLIRDIPWDVLKIDKSFLPGKDSSDESDEQKKVLLKHIISMAQSMGLECIVEGVETPDQVELLIQNGCYMAQGFYFSTPLPVGEFEKNLK